MAMTPPIRRCLIAAFTAFALFWQGAPLIAGETAPDANMLPVPSVTIYPGDVISGMLIVEREFPTNAVASRFGVATDRAMLVGKIARRTLLPGSPIPANAVMEPRLVINGARVRIVFAEGDLEIITYGAALQAGSAGDLVSVRNLESGLTISGVVQPDGSVRVDGG
jgi:flagella basal body P-ring formation protein FlgA